MQCVRTSRKDGKLAAAHDIKSNFAAGRFANPVFLHQFGFFRPIQCIQPGKQFFRIFGNFKEPLREMFSGDRRMAALTFAVYNLFVGQHGIAMRAPVDRCRGTIGQSLFIELQKTPLCPL